VASVAWVALEILGWGIAQSPFVVYPDLTLQNSAAPDGVLRFVLWTTPPGLALLLPSLWLLFRVFKGQRHHDQE
jgi:cytochrome d ubiquinol oxidase subunit II